MMKKNIKLAIIGLGYVGLPLALEFAKKRKVIGFDINKKRVRDLQNGIDKNLETTNKEFKESKLIKFTDNKNFRNWLLGIGSEASSKKLGTKDNKEKR